MGTHYHSERIRMMGRELEVTFACSHFDSVEVTEGPPLSLPKPVGSKLGEWINVGHEGHRAELFRKYPLMKRLVRIMRKKGLLVDYRDHRGRHRSNRGRSCYCECY